MPIRNTRPMSQHGGRNLDVGIGQVEFLTRWYRRIHKSAKLQRVIHSRPQAVPKMPGQHSTENTPRKGATRLDNSRQVTRVIGSYPGQWVLLPPGKDKAQAKFLGSGRGRIATEPGPRLPRETAPSACPSRGGSCLKHITNGAGTWVTGRERRIGGVRINISRFSL